MSRDVRMAIAALVGCLLPLVGVIGFCWWEQDRIWSPMPWAEATVIQQYEDEIVVRWHDRNGDERRAAIGLYDTAEYPPQERVEILYDLEHPERQIIPLEVPAAGLPYEDWVIDHGLAAAAAGTVVIALGGTGWATNWRIKTLVGSRTRTVRGKGRVGWSAILIVGWLATGAAAQYLSGQLLTVITAVAIVAALTSTLLLVLSMRADLPPDPTAPHAKLLKTLSTGGSLSVCTGLAGYGVLGSVTVDGDDTRLGGYYVLVMVAIAVIIMTSLIRMIHLKTQRVTLAGPSVSARARAWRDRDGRVWLELRRQDGQESLWQRVTWESSVESLETSREVEIRGRFDVGRRVVAVISGQVLTSHGRLKAYPPDAAEPLIENEAPAREAPRWWWRNAAVDYGVVLVVMAVAIQLREPMSIEALLIALVLMAVLLLNVWASAGTRPTDGIVKLPWRR